MSDEHITSITSASLPTGYSQRAATWDDVEAMTHLEIMASAMRNQPKKVTVEHVRSEWQSPHIDFLTASQIVFNPQGEMVGFVTVWDKFNPTHPELEWQVLPGAHWQEILRAVLAWGEARAMQALARCQSEERFAPVLSSNAAYAEEQALFEAAGYQPIRYFQRMTIVMTQRPAVLPLPEGLILRSFNYPSDLEAAILAKEDAWRDHYGYVPRDLSDVIKSWTHIIESDDAFDASIWQLAVDATTGTIAGLILCRFNDEEYTDHGAVEILGVRRAYRKRGLAQALLTHMFADFWARGKTTVGLGVDAGSLTGATRLYERVGMTVAQRFVRMEKELRPGIERMTTGE